MLQKLRGNSQGFTLIELMIVIAIIGILAAIAIPNFIAYRNKSFCSQAESDANNIAGSVADYFAIPSYVNTPTGPVTTSVQLNNKKGVTLSGNNTGTVSDDAAGPNNGITITVTDQSGRCPDDYQSANSDWNTNVFTKVIKP